MATLIGVASRIQDLYEQNYTAGDKFLDIDDFKFQVATTYSSLLNAMYQQERRTNRQMDGWSNIEIPAAWLTREQLKIEEEGDKQYVTISRPVYSFDWDNAANALQGLHSVGNRHCVYRKISLNERRFRQIIPPAGVVFFYLNTPTEIVFWGANAGSEIELQYVPAIVGLEDDCKLSDNIISQIQDTTLERMFKSKSGNFIQKTDDQNPNAAPPQQVNPALPK